MADYHTGGLHLIDVSNPASPQPLGSLPSRHCMYGVEASDNLVFVADGDAGLGIIDASNSAAPVAIGYFNSVGFSRSLAIAGPTLIYLADWNGGLTIINIADPAHPFTVATIDTPGRTPTSPPT